MRGVQAQAIGECFVFGREHAAVAHPAEILGGIETEAADVSPRSGRPIPVAGTNRLGRIFHDVQIVLLSDPVERIHRRALTEQVHWNDRARGARDRRFHLLRVDVEGDRVDVHKDRLRTHAPHAAGRGKEREARHDDLVTGADPQRHHGQQQRVASRRTTDARGTSHRRATSASSSRQSGPCRNRPESTTRAIAARISSRSGALPPTTSNKGTGTELVPVRCCDSFMSIPLPPC